MKLKYSVKPGKHIDGIMLCDDDSNGELFSGMLGPFFAAGHSYLRREKRT